MWDSNPHPNVWSPLAKLALFSTRTSLSINSATPRGVQSPSIGNFTSDSRALRYSLLVSSSCELVPTVHQCTNIPSPQKAVFPSSSISKWTKQNVIWVDTDAIAIDLLPPKSHLISHYPTEWPDLAAKTQEIWPINIPCPVFHAIEGSNPTCQTHLFCTTRLPVLIDAHNDTLWDSTRDHQSLPRQIFWVVIC